jgi:hypothetical protein
MRAFPGLQSRGLDPRQSRLSLLNGVRAVDASNTRLATAPRHKQRRHYTGQFRTSNGPARSTALCSVLAGAHEASSLTSYGPQFWTYHPSYELESTTFVIGVTCEPGGISQPQEQNHGITSCRTPPASPSRGLLRDADSMAPRKILGPITLLCLVPWSTRKSWSQKPPPRGLVLRPVVEPVVFQPASTASKFPLGTSTRWGLER